MRFIIRLRKPPARQASWPREIGRESAEARAGRIIEEEMRRRCLLSTAQ